MTENEASPEILTPGQRFIQIIDTHFVAVGGIGNPGHRIGEEEIKLTAPDFQYPFGSIDPKTVLATRTIPGHEEIVKIGWPAFHGHYVSTFGQNSKMSESLTFFEREGTLWVRGILREEDVDRMNSGGESPISPALIENFLTWLQNCTPFLPHPIADF